MTIVKIGIHGGLTMMLHVTLSIILLLLSAGAVVVYLCSKAEKAKTGLLMTISMVLCAVAIVTSISACSYQKIKQNAAESKIPSVAEQQPAEE